MVASVSSSKSKKFGLVSERRLALYGVAAGAALGAGVSQADANLITLDLTGLPIGARSTPFGGELFFNVNATSATAAVGPAGLLGADFRLSNSHAKNSMSAHIHGLGTNAISGTFKANRFSAGNSVGSLNQPFSTSVKIAGTFLGGHVGNFFPGGTGYLGLRFTIGTDTHYGWANITVNTDYTVALNTLGYESDPNAAARIPSTVPDHGSSIALLAIGAAGIAAFRSRQRKAA